MSGSGKTSVVEGLKYEKLISSTTRPQRPGEVHGVDYKFVSKDVFDKGEYVDKTTYAGYEYGHNVIDVYAALRSPVLYAAVVDSTGAIAIHRYAEARGLTNSLIIIKLVVTAARAVANMHKRGDSDQKIIERLIHALDDDELRMFEELNGFVDANVALPKLIRDVDSCVNAAIKMRPA
jgi:guanylate kinase